MLLPTLADGRSTATSPGLSMNPPTETDRAVGGFAPKQQHENTAGKTTAR